MSTDNSGSKTNLIKESVRVHATYTDVAEWDFGSISVYSGFRCDGSMFFGWSTELPCDDVDAALESNPHAAHWLSIMVPSIIEDITEQYPLVNDNGFLARWAARSETIYQKSMQPENAQK